MLRYFYNKKDIDAAINGEFILRYCHYKKQSEIFFLDQNKLGFHDITICLSGTMQYYVNDAWQTIKSGDIVYFSPSSMRKRLATETKATYLSINLYGADKPLLPGTFFPDIVNKSIVTTIDQIKQALLTCNKEKILVLTKYLILDIKEILVLQQENPTVVKIKKYILNNIYSRILVSDVAKSVFFSTIYCESLFKKNTGKSISGFITEQKMLCAKDMLIVNESSLTNIANFLGYDDYNYFSRVFKKTVGIAPKKFIELNKLQEYYQQI